MIITDNHEYAKAQGAMMTKNNIILRVKFHLLSSMINPESDINPIFRKTYAQQKT